MPQRNQDGHSQLSFLKRDAAPGTAQPWLLMHGVGSNEQDLFGLAPSAQLQGKQLRVSAAPRDLALPPVHAQAVRALAQQWPLILTYAEFPGPHETTSDELAQAMAWLGQLTA